MTDAMDKSAIKMYHGEALKKELKKFTAKNEIGQATLKSLKAVHKKNETAFKQEAISEQEYIANLELFADADVSKLQDDTVAYAVLEFSEKIRDALEIKESDIKDEVADNYSKRLAGVGDDLVDQVAAASLKMVTDKMPENMEAVKNQILQLKKAAAAGNPAAIKMLDELREIIVERAKKEIDFEESVMMDDKSADMIEDYYKQKNEFESSKEMTPELVRAAFDASLHVWQNKITKMEQFENDVIEILGDSRVIKGSPAVIAEAGKVEKEWRDNAMLDIMSTVSEHVVVRTPTNQLVLGK
jgi:hypothetical protein